MAGGGKRFRVVMIKPSHYDDNGYVIQWMKAPIPSNTLAQLYGLAQDCADRKVLGDDIEIVLEPFDETNTVIPLKRIIRKIKADGIGMVGLVGVQSNQFPRAMDMARQLRAADIPVVIGGFHASGCLSMLPELPGDLQEALDLGISLYAGEAEGRLDEVLQDCFAGALKPIYNYMNDLPGLEGAIAPFLPSETVGRTADRSSSFDAGRGCPFQCSFCTIINVQGRKSRFRSADDVEGILRRNLAQGVERFFITDDNFARNKNWESILDRLIAIRREGAKFSIVIQVDTLCHKTPNFIAKAAAAGVKRVFIGLENINPENLAAVNKRQNKIWEYRKMLQAWKAQGVLTYAGYILGFPDDTPASIERDIEIIKRELPIDLLEFFILTPLPGSEDHRGLLADRVWMDPDMNKYDLNHATTDHHPKMTLAELAQAYRDAWHQYYTSEHVETVLRRAASCNMNVGNVAFLMLWFSGSFAIEGIHPLEGGYFRRRVWRQRRSDLARENFVWFHLRRPFEVIDNQVRWLALAWRFFRIRRAVRKDSSARSYTDESMVPVTETEEMETDLMRTHAGKIVRTYGAPIVDAAE